MTKVREKIMRRAILTGLLTALAGLLVGVGGSLALVGAAREQSAQAANADAAPTFVAIADTSTAFNEAIDACNASIGATVADVGRTLIVTAVAGHDSLTGADLRCVLDELHAPASVREHMGSTRALDGQQEDAWPGFTARWTYHPDNGFHLTITKG